MEPTKDKVPTEQEAIFLEPWATDTFFFLVEGVTPCADHRELAFSYFLAPTETRPCPYAEEAFTIL